MPDGKVEQNQASFSRRVLVLVAIGFAAVLIAGIATAWVQARNLESARWVEHTLDVAARVSDFSNANERTETTRRGLLLGGDQRFRVRMLQSAREVDQALAGLVELTTDNPEQQERLAELRRLVAAQRTLQLRSVNAPRAERMAMVNNFDRDPTLPLLKRIREVATSMVATERGLLAEREAGQKQLVQLFYALLAIAGLLVLVVGTMTYAVIQRYTRDLMASRRELRRLNEGLEDAVRARTSELQRANDEIQRFAYIVSHDLRSPLVNVMGFTAELDAARKTVAGFIERVEARDPELIDTAVREAVGEELPESIGFIRSSTQKMDRLINAILRLSREGRRTLTVERIDMNALVRGIIDSLQHRVNDLGAEVQVAALPDITNDRVAIEQILSNLIENAVKYLAPGRPGLIRVSGRADRERAVFEVSDNGRGIDPRDHERVFDLFRRSGTQDQPGEGIGLAHVRALAYRLGGLIELQSELDRGSTFRLVLPVVLTPGE
jgi:signal transduction histidine kinase